MIHAAGLFLIRKDDKILVGHPTRQNPNFWSIPKGKVEDNESNCDAAIRETFEETNVDVSNWVKIHKLSDVKYTNVKKILHPFVIFEHENFFNFNKFELKCNSFVSKDKGGFPEMDDFRFITFEEAYQCLHSSQIKCLTEIKNLIILDEH